MHHHHHHGTGKILKWSFYATLLFCVIELIAGIRAGSLALVSDAGHNFTDALAIALAALGFRLQSKPANSVKTYGYHRAGVLTAFANALTLIGIALFIFYEAWQRLLHPQPVSPGGFTRRNCRALIAAQHGNAATPFGQRQQAFSSLAGSDGGLRRFAAAPGEVDC